MKRVNGEYMFDPKTKKYPYPEDTASHYIKFKKQKDIKTGSNKNSC